MWAQHSTLGWEGTTDEAGDAELLDWLVLKSFLREQTSALGANVR